MDYQPILAKAREGVNGYLETNLRDGKIDQQSFDLATQNTMALLEEWLSDPKIDELSPNLKAGIAEAVENKEWEPLVNAFRKKMSFGTGGIRGLMAHDKKSILRLKEDGLDATFLKGPNTLNNLVLLQVSAGVAQFGRDKGFNKIVIGYDSRIRGYDFAKAIAEEFLAYGFTVYLFDAPCPYPEVTYAIPFKDIKAHMGILVSASHNDYRYNGYKLSCGNGSQFDPEERAEMYDDYIVKSTPDDVKSLKIEDTPEGKFFWLGGESLLPDFDYKGHEKSLMDVHSPHRDHIKTFLLKDVTAPRKLNMGYCAFHGAGRIAVPRLLKDIGFDDVKIISHNGLFELNGMFPSFCSDPGMEQQPDPGDPRAAKVEVEAFKADFPNDWEANDIIIGTDPDADRCGVVVKVPEDQQFLFGDRDYMLLPADDLWALLIWFRLKFDTDFKPEEAFVTLSHTTT
ncbi:hypothetical protein KAH55_03880, partial [bacterium]|nr:hypothetical protein [bacterium]